VENQGTQATAADGKRAAAPTQHHRHRAVASFASTDRRQHQQPPPLALPSGVYHLRAPLPPPTASGGGARTPETSTPTNPAMNLLGVRTNFRVIPLIISISRNIYTRRVISNPENRLLGIYFDPNAN